MRVVVNHLKLISPIPREVITGADEVCREIVAAGGLSACLVEVHELHAILVLTFPDLQTEERIASSIGGPWMVENILPILSAPPERSSGELVAGG